MDAHEHGVTTLNIALDGGTLILELEGPAMNFVGFEHPPGTDEQKRAITAALQTLNEDPGLFEFDAAAGCALVEAGIGHISEDEHDDHEGDHDSDEAEHDDHDAEAQHSEFAGEYRYDCNSPQNLSEIRVGLFDRFPLTTEVEASFVGPDVQTYRELVPDNPVFQVRT